MMAAACGIPSMEERRAGEDTLTVRSPSQADGRLERAVIRQVHRPQPGTIRLWTIQPIEVWTALRRDGVLYVAEQLMTHLDDFREEYDWMREQMRERIPGYGGRYPWWAYDHRLDLRFYRFDCGPPGSRLARLELAVAREQVLLSGYYAWHAVLNRWYLPQATQDPEYERERNAWDAELEAAGIDPDAWPLPEPYQSRMVWSWKRIFDVKARRASDAIQATFETLALADVVAVTEFTAPPETKFRQRLSRGS